MNHLIVNNKAKILLIITVLIVLSATFISKLSAVIFIQDDAFISLRYANNFLLGKGLVFNPGEYVEGYTNFLWVVLLVLSGLLGGDIVYLSQIYSIGFGILLLFTIYFFTFIESC